MAVAKERDAAGCEVVYVLLDGGGFPAEGRKRGRGEVAHTNDAEHDPGCGADAEDEGEGVVRDQRQAEGFRVEVAGEIGVSRWDEGDGGVLRERHAGRVAADVAAGKLNLLMMSRLIGTAHLCTPA